MKTLDEVEEFHGHMCPGLALGYRVSLLALSELGERARDEELAAEVENDSCAVDAVQVMTGCTFGKGNLVFKDYGKQVYRFIKRPSGDSLRVSVNWVAPPETDDEKAAWERYAGGDRTEEVVRKVHERKSRKVKAIMEAPEEELFKVTRERTQQPPAARIYPSATCALCGEKVMEPRAKVLKGRIVCIPCFEGDRAG